MSDYNCFNCSKLIHVSELHRVEWKGLVSLLCQDCINRIFIKEELYSEVENEN